MVLVVKKVGRCPRLDNPVDITMTTFTWPTKVARSPSLPIRGSGRLQIRSGPFELVVLSAHDQCAFVGG